MKNLIFIALTAICIVKIQARPIETPDIYETVTNISSHKPRLNHDRNEPWEINQDNGLNLFEGDIINHPIIHQSNTRNAVNNDDDLWRNGEIPYFIEGAYSYEERMIIVKSLDEFGARTCNTFRPKQAGDINYIGIIRGDGCYSSVGMAGGRQTMSIGYGCIYKGTIQHEAMHAVGFWHEQSRYDRDDYVEVIWDNIIEGQEYNFNKYDESSITTLGLDYDYESIMHYGPTYFTSNGDETIVLTQARRDAGQSVTMGQRSHFTDLDIAKQRKLYNCDASQFVGWSSWSLWSECDTECIQQRWRWCNSDICDGDSEQSTTCSDCVVGHDPDCSVNEFTGRVGSISSPMYPNDYKNYADCTYTVYAEDPSLPLYIMFARFGVEPETNCGFDYLQIFENGAGVQSDRLCGNELPPAKTYNVDKLEFVFHSDSSTTDIGYKILYFNVPVIQIWPFENTFEENGWIQDDTDDFNWIQGQGHTPSAGTGPSNDHTLNDQNGHYMFIETSSPREGPQIATIYSPIVDPINGDACVQFFWHMYGQYMGELIVNVIIHNDDGLTTSNEVFYKKGDSGNVWFKQKFTPPTGKHFALEFKAIRGGGYLSDMAIDDVGIYGVKCEDL